MEITEYHNIINAVKGLIAGTKFESKVYSVGGCERDRILGNEIKDIDFAVEIKNGGIELGRYLEEKGVLLGPPVVFERYGTCKFRLREFPMHDLEAVQTRKEKYNCYTSRNPETAYGTIKDDAIRRDLTINALYRNVSTEELVDLVGGVDDIKNCVLRTTSDPDFVFDDDPLRMLRVIRFSTKLGWEIDHDVLASIKKNAKRIRIITRERCLDELIKILSSNNPQLGFELLNSKTNLFFQAFHICNVSLKKEWNIMDCMAPGDLVRNLAAKIINICDVLKAQSYMQLIKLDNNTMHAVLKVINDANFIIHIDYESKIAGRKIMTRFNSREEHLRAENLALKKLTCERNRRLYLKVLNNSRHCMDMLDEKTWNYGMKLPLNGDDIISEFKVSGKEVGAYLKTAWNIYYEFPTLNKTELIEKLKYAVYKQS